MSNDLQWFRIERYRQVVFAMLSNENSISNLQLISLCITPFVAVGFRVALFSISSCLSLSCDSCVCESIVIVPVV